MKKVKILFRLCAPFLVFSIFISGAAFSQTQDSKKIDSIAKSFNSFGSDLNCTLQNAAVNQNISAPAWIGNLIPAPVHFYAGLDFGASSLNLSHFNDSLKELGLSSIPENLVYPTVAGSIRLGGIGLPFDAGFSFLKLNLKDIDSIIKGLTLNYLVIGGDLRFAILRGEEKLPALSVGAGFYYLDGKIGYTQDYADLNIDFDTKTFFASVQLSKTFIFFTPFIGFKGIISDSNTYWAWSISDSAMSKLSVSALKGKGKANTSYGESFIPQVYGGFGLKLSIIELTLNGAWDFKNSIWSAGTSLRLRF